MIKHLCLGVIVKFIQWINQFESKSGPDLEKTYFAADIESEVDIQSRGIRAFLKDKIEGQIKKDEGKWKICWSGKQFKELSKRIMAERV